MSQVLIHCSWECLTITKSFSIIPAFSLALHRFHWQNDQGFNTFSASWRFVSRWVVSSELLQRGGYPVPWSFCPVLEPFCGVGVHQKPAGGRKRVVLCLLFCSCTAVLPQHCTVISPLSQFLLLSFLSFQKALIFCFVLLLAVQINLYLKIYLYEHWCIQIHWV